MAWSKFSGEVKRLELLPFPGHLLWSSRGAFLPAIFHLAFLEVLDSTNSHVP